MDFVGFQQMLIDFELFVLWILTGFRSIVLLTGLMDFDWFQLTLLFFLIFVIVLC